MAWSAGTEWTQEDALAWASFLKSGTGLRLSATLRNTAIENNANAIMSSKKDRCDQAAGWLQCIAYIETLSAQSEPQSDTSGESSEGAAELLARLAP
jgi:hypothetical protein